MIVNVNMSKEVYEYYKAYDLSQVVNTLMDMYDFTNLPAVTGRREVERQVNVTNEMFLSLYETLGPRSKKLSIGRLLEFGYNTDVLAMPRFEQMRANTVVSDPTKSLLIRAYKALLSAQKYDSSEELKLITNLVYEYKETYNG